MVKFPRRLTTASRYNSWRTDRQPKWHVPTQPPDETRIREIILRIILQIDQDIKPLHPFAPLAYLLHRRDFPVFSFTRVEREIDGCSEPFERLFVRTTRVNMNKRQISIIHATAISEIVEQFQSQ